MRLCIIVLAAGQGSRFGGGANKLLMPCVGRDSQSRPVLGHVLHNLAGIEGRRLLITRPGQPPVASLARAQGYEVLEVASAGIGETLAAAVRHTGPGFRWLIALGDMPFILPETLQQLAERGLAMAASAVCAPSYGSRLGHPVIFAESFFEPLASLEGDRGGRSLFNDASRVGLETEDRGIHHDVDTPEALIFT